jgi:hypothetical protein
VKPALLQALVATYGPVDGREATVDALSWAWEHWDRLADVDHPVGYLYRVGQSATRRFLPRPVPARLAEILETQFPDVEPRLLPAGTPAGPAATGAWLPRRPGGSSGPIPCSQPPAPPAATASRRSARPWPATDGDSHTAVDSLSPDWPTSMSTSRRCGA